MSVSKFFLDVETFRTVDTNLTYERPGRPMPSDLRGQTSNVGLNYRCLGPSEYPVETGRPDLPRRTEVS